MRTKGEGSINHVMLIISVLLLFAYVVPAQSNLVPAPPSLRVANENNSPVTIAISGIPSFQSDYRPLQYSVHNSSGKPILAMVVVGLPGVPSQLVGLERGLRSGATRTFTHGNVRDDSPNESIVRADFVLFMDGTTWGPDTAKESAFVLGVFEGQKAAVSGVKKVTAQKNESALRALITGQYADPPGSESETKRNEGFGRGYAWVLHTFRADLEQRGDLKAVQPRIEDWEYDLGLALVRTVDRRRIGRVYDANEPVRVIGLSKGNKEFGLDESFVAGPDWFSDLRFRIKNNSGKTITYVSLGIDFPETSMTGTPMRFSASYGVSPLGIVQNTRISVPAGETFELVIDEDRFRQLVRFIESRTLLNSLTRANLNFQIITYDDGTGWSGGVQTRRDPNDPKRYIPINSSNK